ncbi:MAG: type II secretion system protein [Candidatus Komeilibacteria bacterium]|nr:type II secretion system protein [Candidatus Komeilibacteria bacterium]
MFRGKTINQSGLTLVETILALAILTLAVTFLASLFPHGLKISTLSQEETIAAFLAQAKIEELISANYAETPTATTVESNLSGLDADFSGFSRTTVVSYVDGNLDPSAADLGLKKISVTVSWLNNLSQATSSLNLFSLINDY